MNDTTPEMHRKQMEIMLAMTPRQRAMCGIEMMDFGKRTVEGSIKATNPDISDLEMKIEVFKRFYRNDFEPEELEKIIAFFRAKG